MCVCVGGGGAVEEVTMKQIQSVLWKLQVDPNTLNPFEIVEQSLNNDRRTRWMAFWKSRRPSEQTGDTV